MEKKLRWLTVYIYIYIYIIKNVTSLEDSVSSLARWENEFILPWPPCLARDECFFGFLRLQDGSTSTNVTLESRRIEKKKNRYNNHELRQALPLSLTYVTLESRSSSATICWVQSEKCGQEDKWRLRKILKGFLETRFVVLRWSEACW